MDLILRKIHNKGSTIDKVHLCISYAWSQQGSSRQAFLKLVASKATGLDFL